jgi:hypothetical protein
VDLGGESPRGEAPEVGEETPAVDEKADGEDEALG